MGVPTYISKFLSFCKQVLSEPDGTASSTRTLMYIFSFFSMWLIWRCFYHIVRLTDQAMLSIWLSNMPLLITTLMGLISLPYAVNKGTNTMSDIATMIANAKQNKVDTTITGSFSKSAPSVTPTAAPAAPAAPISNDNVGTSGVVKG